MIDKNLELKNTLRKMLKLHLENKQPLENKAFCCSKIWDNGMNIYKGIPVYYFNAILMGDKILLIDSPMMQDYETEKM